MESRAAARLSSPCLLPSAAETNGCVQALGLPAADAVRRPRRGPGPAVVCGPPGGRLPGEGAAGVLRGAGLLRDRSGGVILPLMSAVTRILNAIEQGDPHAAGQLLPLV